MDEHSADSGPGGEEATALHTPSVAARAFGNAYLLRTLAALFWAGNFVLARGVHEEVPPIALAWWRWALAFAILLPFALPYMRRDWPQLRAGIGILILLGILGVGCFNTFAYIGLNDTTALNAVVMQSSGPILIAIVGYALFRDQVTAAQAIGILVSLIGVAVVVSRGSIGSLLALGLNPGDLWILGAIATWAVYTAYLRKRPDVHWLSFTAATFFIGLIAITPLYIWEHVTDRQMRLDWETGLAVGYVAIFPSVLAYIFFNRGVELIGGTRTGLFLHLVPLFGALLAMIFLDETPRAFHVVGIALILIGVWLGARRPS